MRWWRNRFVVLGILALCGDALAADPAVPSRLSDKTPGPFTERQEQSDGRLAVLPRGVSLEVMIASVGCSEDSMTLDFHATGSALEGLQRPFTPGSANFLYVRMPDCPAAMGEILAIASARDCPLATEYTSSVSFVCQGPRDGIVDTVGRALKIAWTHAFKP